MSAEPVFDPELAHTHFSVECFNATWELIDKKERTPDEDLVMLGRAMASLWHWTQRPDCTARNLSIGYWQVSRVCALIGEGTLARRYAEACLRFSRDEGPYFLGYAYECLARSAKLSHTPDEALHFLAEARRCAQLVEEAEERIQLEQDLDSLAD